MPATKAAAPVAVKTPASAADLTVLAKRAPAYKLDPKATRGNTGDQSFVTRGVNVKSSVKSLVHVNGESQTALPLAVIGAAIISGVITREEIEYLWSLAG